MIRTAEGNSLQLKEGNTFSGTWSALLILAKPGIVAAVTLSGYTGMVVAGRGLPEIETALPCVASLLFMAAGSAVINSILDRNIDEQMERLTARSAALRRVGMGTALASAVVLTAAAVALASELLSSKAALLLVAAALSYTLYYTLFLKRRTPWAAVLGGLPGAFPVLIGHAAVTPEPDPASFALFLIMLIWQPPHFWLLSLSHHEEYRAAEVPVLPVIKGDRFTKGCIYAGIAGLIPASLLLSYAGPCSAGCATCALLLGSAYLLASHYFITGGNYRAAFRGSIAYILILFILIIADLGI